MGIGRHEYPILAQAYLMGGHVRVGLEDNIYIEKGVLATDNKMLVEKAVRILKGVRRPSGDRGRGARDAEAQEAGSRTGVSHRHCGVAARIYLASQRKASTAQRRQVRTSFVELEPSISVR